MASFAITLVHNSAVTSLGETKVVQTTGIIDIAEDDFVAIARSVNTALTRRNILWTDVLQLQIARQQTL